MRSWRQFSRFAAVATAAVSFSGAYLIYNTGTNPARASGGTSSDEIFEAGRLLFKPSGLRWDPNWDMCDTGSTKKRKKEDVGVGEEKEIKPTAVRHLLFIRHGQYNTNGENDDEKVLTELGRLQAKQTGERLKELDLKYTKLVCSTMKRAVESADIVAQFLPDVPRETCCMLREGSPVVPDPSSSSWRPEKKFFKDGPRIEAAFRKYFHRADTDQVGDSVEIYVCHANVIRYFVCRALQFPPEGWLRMNINHCGITWVTIKPNGRVCLKSFGDTGHLPPNNITSS